MKATTIFALLFALSCSKSTKSDESKQQPPAPVTAAGSGSAAPTPAATTERWAATFVIGLELKDFVVAFTRTGETWSANLEKHGKQRPLSAVTFAPDHMAFQFDDREYYEVTREPNAAEAKGTAKLGGGTLPFRMSRLAEGEAPRSAFPRPQTPKPPFPYDAREVTVDAPDGGKLAGTLTVPREAGPHPAVLLWSGSGQEDRDETIYGHKPWLLVADRLTRKGFVVLRLDDRGTGKTTGAVGTLNTEIADAGAAVEFLKTQTEVAPTRIGMIAHSTGGMVAPNVALAHPVAFIVSLAGVAIPGRELTIVQKAAAAKARGVPVNPDQLEVQKALGDASVKGPDEMKRVLVALIGAKIEKAAGRKATAAEIDQVVAPILADSTGAWNMSYFTIDPRVAWKKLQIPVLLVVGDKDTQVPSEVTINALTESHGKPAVVTTKTMPGLNHLFQHANTGLDDEYMWIDETFDPATLDLVETWLAGR
jgi:uncharacterized protein